MKLIVAGGRKYDDFISMFSLLKAFIRNHDVEMIIEGGAPGADRYARAFAILMDIPYKTIEADWFDFSPPVIFKKMRNGKKYNALAGPKRNAKMASMADAVAIFPGGRGTQSMYDEAVKAGLKIFDYRNIK